MNQQHVLITGANGQLGQEFRHLISKQDWIHPMYCSKEELDIGNEKDVEDFFEKNEIDFCINCAAYTAVDKAESEAELAYAINTQAVKNLASICLAKQVFLIHFSSDYIYHSIEDRPLLEDDPKEPKSVYAKSKLEGEKFIQEINPNYLIFRSSWIYSTFGHNFVKTMLRLGKERDELNVVNDQIGVPTYAGDIAEMVITIVQKLANDELNAESIRGIYNYCNKGISSWFELAKFIMDYKNLDCRVHPIPTSDYPTAAVRPFNSQLSLNKFNGIFEIEIPTWEESVEKVLEML